MLVEVEVYRKVLQFLDGTAMVLLRDKVSGSRMPISIDPFTANAIFVALRGGTNKRPLTHDLLKSFLIEDANAVITKAVITELKENIFYALIHYDKDDEARTKDSRPSDAIALATLFSAPIFVEEALWLEMLGDPNNKENLATFEKLEPRLPDLYPPEPDESAT